MIPGYNHNIKYKDRIFHVQTEDSGVQNPHIITHLFVGGNIIVSLKTSYADIVTQANLNDLVVDLMQGQHKTVLKDLVRGKYDAEVAARSKNAGALNGPAPLNVEAGAQNRSSFGGGLAAAPNAPAAGAPPPAALGGTPPPAPLAKGAAIPPPRPGSLPPAAIAAEARQPAAAASTSIFGGPATPPPAPPPTSGKIIEAEALEAAFESKDEKAVDSIFGNLISEKSLDEVILSYLADDKPRS